MFEYLRIHYLKIGTRIPFVGPRNGIRVFLYILPGLEHSNIGSSISSNRNNNRFYCRTNGTCSHQCAMLTGNSHSDPNHTLPTNPQGKIIGCSLVFQGVEDGCCSLYTRIDLTS